MSDACVDFGIAGAALAIRGPGGWLAPLGAAWSAWSPSADGAFWDVQVVENAALAAPHAPLFETLPRCHHGRCELEAPGFYGVVDAAQGCSRIEAHPRATSADIGYFVRVTLAVHVFARGGMLFHAAGILHHTWGYAFFGLSGSGKTTASQFSAPDPVLNDDLLVLWPDRQEWQIYATPFGKRRGDVRTAPLRALLRLVKDTRVFLDPLPKSRALAELVSNTPVLSADAAWLPDVLSRWETVITVAPVYALHFRRDPAFWEVIDGALG